MPGHRAPALTVALALPRHSSGSSGSSPLCPPCLRTSPTAASSPLCPPEVPRPCLPDPAPRRCLQPHRAHLR
jgi:hypothetical protein